MFCKKCGKEIADGTIKCPYCGELNTTYGMKWFKFLIYFALWAGGILNIISGVLSVTNISLSIVYVIYGVLVIALGAFQIYTRFQLAGFKSKAPLFVYIIYAANIVLPVIYALAGTDFVTALTDNLASMVVSVIMLIVNLVYFGKRKEMFNN